MPRFFYDFFDGDAWHEDDVGLDLASAEQAYLEAFDGARSMWPDLIEARRDPRRCVFEVRAAGRELLFRFDFTETLESCRLPAVRRLPVTSIALQLAETHRVASAIRADMRTTLEDVHRLLGQSKELLNRVNGIVRD